MEKLFYISKTNTIIFNYVILNFNNIIDEKKQMLDIGYILRRYFKKFNYI